jgi:ABC-2 type transport system ATP-binding protein
MIEISKLTKSYGPRMAIDSLNFSVAQGEVLGFLGPNGAGKSTTMKILTGYMPATSGTARVAGFDVFENPIEVKRNVGYLPEEPPVYRDMRVRDYLAYAANLRGVASNQVRTACDSAMERTGLTEVAGRLIGNLSKGYRQRTGLAQALVHNPKVLILDEPTEGLDPIQRIEIRKLIGALAQDHTVVLSTHILAEVTATCTRAIIINKGKIAADQKLSGDRNALVLTVKQASSQAIHALSAIPGVASATSSGNRVVVELSNGTDVRERVAETAVKEGMGVLEFTSSKNVNLLEELFLRVASGD